MDAAAEPDGTAAAGAAAAPEPQSGVEKRHQHEDEQDARLFTLPGLEGQWTLAQLVEMEQQKDPRFTQVRRGALPPEFWGARRRARNRERTLRNYQRRRRKGDAAREEDAARKAELAPEQAAAYEARREAEREAAKAAAAAQRAAVAEAMASGLRIVIDCSFSVGDGASDREVRSLCKQLQECAAANKRARRPVSLQFASFTGAVRQFAVDGMHADRWPAAAGHEAPLADLFPPGDLVVLSPDAEEPLAQLEADKVYVIGGLVDRTVRKGASLGLAQRCGARAVRLPIVEHLGTAALGSSKGVLNVNDVFNALLAVHAGDSWQAALDAAIPKRFRAEQPSSDAGQRGQRQRQQAVPPQKRKAEPEAGDQREQQQTEQQQQQQQTEQQQQKAHAQAAADKPECAQPGEAAAAVGTNGGAEQQQLQPAVKEAPPRAPPGSCGCCCS